MIYFGIFSRFIGVTGHPNVLLTLESITEAGCFCLEIISLVSIIIFHTHTLKCAASMSINMGILLSFLVDMQVTATELSICWQVSCTYLDFFCHLLFFLPVICLSYFHLFFFYLSYNLIHAWATCCFIYMLPNQLYPWKFQGFFCKYIIIFLTFFSWHLNCILTIQLWILYIFQHH